MNKLITNPVVIIALFALGYWLAEVAKVAFK